MRSLSAFRLLKRRAKPGQWGIIAAILILYIVWGSTYLANKLALTSMLPFPMLCLRFLSAGGILYVFLRLKGLPNPTLREWRASAIVGILLLNGGLGLVVFAQQWVSSGLAAVIVATMPLWFAFFARFFGGKTRSVEVIAMVLGLIGVACLNGEADLALHPLALLVFIGPIVWAFGSAYSQTLSQAKGLMASAVQMLVAGGVFAVIMLIRGESIFVPVSFLSLASVSFLVFFGSIIGYSAYLYLLEQNLSPALTTSYAYVNPVIAVILGVGFVGEHISPLGYLGMVFIILSVLLVVATKTLKPAHTKSE